jgi:hypothetical protein
MNRVFSDWTSWKNRVALTGVSFPGIYAVAISTSNIAETPFNWIRDIVYVGMTNAKGGLNSRLRQFDNTIKGGGGHGGAHRVRFKHSNYPTLLPNLYVAIKCFECDVTSNQPYDLRIMGEVAQHEFECFAHFVESFGRLPEFNDKMRSPKN